MLEHSASDAEDLLSSVLLLLNLLSRTSASGDNAGTGKTVLGLVLLGSLRGVVYQSKAGGLAAAEVGSEAEEEDLSLGGLVHGGELGLQLSAGNVGASGVDHVNDLISRTHAESDAEQKNEQRMSDGEERGSNNKIQFYNNRKYMSIQLLNANIVRGLSSDTASPAIKINTRTHDYLRTTHE